MKKQFFLLLCFLISTILFAQEEKLAVQQTPNRTKVKGGIKMYELKGDGNSGVLIVEPKSDIKQLNQHNSVEPSTNDTTSNRR